MAGFVDRDVAVDLERCVLAVHQPPIRRNVVTLDIAAGGLGAGIGRHVLSISFHQRRVPAGRTCRRADHVANLAPQDQLQYGLLGGEFADFSAETPVLICEPLLQIDVGGKPCFPAVERRACHAEALADRLNRDALVELL
jgi:hypothetical protein